MNTLELFSVIAGGLSQIEKREDGQMMLYTNTHNKTLRAT